jgi:hypothetical protein
VNLLKLGTVLTPAVRTVMGPEAAARLEAIHAELIPAARMSTAEDVAAFVSIHPPRDPLPRLSRPLGRPRHAGGAGYRRPTLASASDPRRSLGSVYGHSGAFCPHDNAPAPLFGQGTSVLR